MNIEKEKVILIKKWLDKSNRIWRDLYILCVNFYGEFFKIFGCDAKL